MPTQPDPTATPNYWSQSDINAAQNDGKDLLDNPASSLPPLAGWGQAPAPDDRDTLISALMGMRQSAADSENAAKFGDPVTAALAAIGGAAAAPSPQAIAAQRQALNAQRQMQMISSMPVDEIAPNIVAAHPELKGLPLGVVERISPILGRYQQMANQFYSLDQAAALMAPENTPGAIANKKAELQQLYPNGMVPKDFAHVAAMNGRGAMTFGQKQDMDNQKRLTALGDALDPNKARAGQFGVSQQVYNRAERLQSLANAYKDGNLDPRQMEELAIGLNSMLSGSNTGASEQVKGLVPNTIMGNAQKLSEWLTNNPTGTKQQAFVQRMLGSVEREKNTAADQIKRVQFQRIARFADLEKKMPDDFYNTLESSGIDLNEYSAWKKGGFKAISAVQAPEGQNPPSVSDLQSSAMAELKRRGL